MAKNTANIVALTLSWMIPFLAQAGPKDSTDVMMAQWKSIADSVSSRIPGVLAGRTVLVVEAGKNRTLIENAFLESFEKKGIRLSLVEEKPSTETHVLRISDITEVPPVSCDARWEEEAGATYLGRFRSTAGEFQGNSTGKETAIGRFIEPLVVIAGAVIVVYLFFTVRS